MPPRSKVSIHGVGAEQMNEVKSLIRLSKSSLSELEKKAVMGVLDREFLGMGAEVIAFEAALTEYFGRPAVCVVNGTAALHLALQSCGVGYEDEVLVPSLTYIASFQAISATGATPVACDIDPVDCLIDLHDAEKRLTSKTKAIMPVHYSGGVGELDDLYAFAQKHNLRVIEDAAHAFGTVYNNKRIGSFGDIACFSFDGIKNLTSGEGGCVVCDDAEVLQKVRDARLLGVENDTAKRSSGDRSWVFDVSAQGWRYHMSNMMAAIGIVQLERFNDFSLRRRRLAQLYDEKLSKFENLVIIARDYDVVVPHIYVVRIINGFDRGEVRQLLLKDHIQTGIHYQPNHQVSLFKRDLGNPLPVTEKVSKEILTLPLHFDLTDNDVYRVCESLYKILES
jgi:dTDP-4-amino-4,6-dideoxygalactose transaminase